MFIAVHVVHAEDVISLCRHLRLQK